MQALSTRLGAFPNATAIAKSRQGRRDLSETPLRRDRLRIAVTARDRRGRRVAHDAVPQNGAIGRAQRPGVREEGADLLSENGLCSSLHARRRETQSA